MAVKAWHHTSLSVSNLDRAISFYRRAFGYEILFEERGMSDQIASMTGTSGLACDLVQLCSPVSGHVLELIAFRGTTAAAQVPPSEAKPLRPGMAHVAFYVDDLEEMLAKVEDLGAVKIGEITRFSDGRSVYCREPSGTFFEMEELSKDLS
jgi:catechol 2,3-dioxygenase-like lactoylglutathione lyase family enzyme